MYSELVYDYECRTVTPDEAAAMLRSEETRLNSSHPK